MDNRFQTLYRGAPLTAAEMETLFDELFAGTLPPEKLASLLTALIMRGATPPEIAGAARSMRRAALPFPTDRATGDVVGTGGDDAGTFNVSTTVALPAAGAGLPIVKNGNCGVSSPSGAADVLEALGVPVDLTPEEGLEALKATNFAFCFARNHHPAMRFAAPVRKCLEAPTLFNLLWPLRNPLDEAARRAGIGLTAILPPPTRTTPPRGPSRGWRAGTRICSPAPASPGQRGTRSARPSAFSRCSAKPGRRRRFWGSASRRRRTSGLRSRRAPRARFRARPSCGGSKRRFPMSRARRGRWPSSSGR